jgi:nucleoside-diphosphate-sugar epimerase
VHLVIGADTFAGVHVALALHGQAAVRALAAPASTAVAQGDADLVEAEIGDRAALAAAMDGVEVAYMCAETPPELRTAPLARPALLLPAVVAAARAAGVRRLVYVSTADVLGSERAGRMSEVSRPRPDNAFERAKLREEEYLRAEVDDLEWVIVRPARGIGVHDRLWSEYLVRQVVAGGRIWQVGGGRVFQSFITGPDLGRALAAAARRGQPGHTYLAGGFDATWRELMEAAAIGLGVPLHVQPVPFDLAFLQASIRQLLTAPGKPCWPNAYAIDAFGRPHLYDDSRSRRQLTWSPQVGSVAEAIADVVASQRAAVPVLSAPPGR